MAANKMNCLDKWLDRSSKFLEQGYSKQGHIVSGLCLSKTRVHAHNLISLPDSASWSLLHQSPTGWWHFEMVPYWTHEQC